MTDRLHNVQRHRLVGQEAQSPAGMPGRRRPAPECDQACLTHAIQEWRAGGALLWLPVEGGLQPVFDQTLSDAQHSINTDGEALSDLGIRPSRAIRIGFQQDISMAYHGVS